jgi:plastocyanin
MKVGLTGLLIIILLIGITITGCAQKTPPTNTGQTQQTPPADTSGQQAQTGQTPSGEQTNQTQPQQTPASQGTGDQSSTMPSQPAKTYDVTIQNFAFDPFSLNINKGDTVVWTNKDSATHTVASDSGNEISSPGLSTGDTYSHTFNSAGTFNYHCGIHQTMKAKVVVN